TDNAAITQQQVSLTGKGGQPQVFYPASVSVSDLVVGTQAETMLALFNSGDGHWIVTNATTTGDFTPANQCPSPILPGGACSIGLIFAPKQAGTRSGTLTITDNVPPGSHTVQLTGTGLATYPVPSVSSIVAVPMDAQPPQLFISGDNFFP